MTEPRTAQEILEDVKYYIISIDEGLLQLSAHYKAKAVGYAPNNPKPIADQDEDGNEIECPWQYYEYDTRQKAIDEYTANIQKGEF